jgi:hypothetical protein
MGLISLIELGRAAGCSFLQFPNNACAQAYFNWAYAAAHHPFVRAAGLQSQQSFTLPRLSRAA